MNRLNSAIFSAYKLFLDLNSRNEEIVHYHRSDEFLNKFGMTSPYKTGLCDPCTVEHEAKDEQLDVMLSHIKNIWTTYGDNDPFWSVITSEKFSRDSISDESKQEFYRSGEESCRFLTDSLKRNDISLDRLSSCLEFGCGTGRITGHLAKLFKNVIACDISKPHLKIAEEHAIRENIKNVSFRDIYSPHELSEIKKGVDVIFSMIVLQHNPPPLIAEYIKAFFKILNPGGVAFFQVPTHKKGYSFSIDRYLDDVDNINIMEMHALPQKAIFEIVRNNNFIVLEVREDSWVGDAGTISNTFLIQRL